MPSLPSLASLIGLSLAAPCVLTAQERPNLTGFWVLQAEQSDLGSALAPTIRVDVIDHQEPRITIRRTVMGPAGESTATLELAVDGKPHTNRVGSNQLISTLKWEGASLLLLSTVTTAQQGEVTITDRTTLSADGKTMTMARHLLTREGLETHQKFVFAKQAAIPPSDSLRLAAFELFLGPWDFPPDAVKRSPQLAEFYARHDEWGPRRRTVRIRETVHRENHNRLVLEGFAYWHPVDDKIRFAAYNVQQKFLFEGEFPVLEPRRIVQEYSVHYPSDFTFTEYPELRGPVRRYREERRLPDDTTMVTTLQILVNGRWAPWPSADAKPFVTTRARVPGVGLTGAADSAPAWFRRHLEGLTRGSGRWTVDNAGFISQSEPWDHYGLEWTWGLGRQSVKGRLYAIKDGKEVGSLFEYRIFWHPGEQKAMVFQYGSDGTYGFGIVEPDGAEGTAVEQTFYQPDGGTFRTRHQDRLAGDVREVQSLNSVNGNWEKRRLYFWKRAT